jgi:hypothetical protein
MYLLLLSPLSFSLWCLQNLEGMQGRAKITNLIEIKVQMDATASGE